MALHHAQTATTGIHRPFFPTGSTDPTTLYTVPEGAVWLDTSTTPPTLKEYVGGAWVARYGAAKVHDHDHTATAGDGGDLDGARVGDFLEFAEVAAPASPAAGLVRVYAKSDGNLYQKDDAGTETGLAGGGGGGDVATDTIFDAKGDLPVGTGADTAQKLAVGANGLVLVADSTQATGLKWAVQGGGIVHISKAADETLNNVGSLQDDDDFSLAIGASEKWIIIFNLDVNTGSNTPDLRFSLSSPASCAWHLSAFGPTTGSTSVSNTSAVFSHTTSPDGNTIDVGAVSGSNGSVFIVAQITNGANAGTVRFRWCQAVATASNTTIRAQSSMLAVRGA